MHTLFNLPKKDELDELCYYVRKIYLYSKFLLSYLTGI